MSSEGNPFEADLAAVDGKLALSQIASAEDLLCAAGADDVLRLLQRLGFWVGGGVRPDRPPVRFNPRLAELSPTELGNTAGFWQSELSRVTAVIGALEAAQRRVRHEIRVVRAKEMARLVREASDRGDRPPARTVLEVLAAEHPQVGALEHQQGVLESVSVALSAAKDAIEGYCRVLSRELTRRGDLLRAGVG